MGLDSGVRWTREQLIEYENNRYGADPDHTNNAGKSPRMLASTIANFDLSQFFD
jgi:hypothetical protein